MPTLPFPSKYSLQNMNFKPVIKFGISYFSLRLLQVVDKVSRWGDLELEEEEESEEEESDEVEQVKLQDLRCA